MKRLACVLGAVSLALVVAPGCPDSSPSPPPPAVSSPPAPPVGATPPALAEVRRTLAWTMPATWQVRPDPSGMRSGSFALPEHPDADCSITVLPGGAANLGANVNRWRVQMGLAEVAPEAIGQLPTRVVLGTSAVLVELDGTYTGMDTVARPGWKLEGIICPLGSGAGTVFVKLVGPAVAVATERAAFLALGDSLRLGEPAPAPAKSGDALGWTVPQGWTMGPPKPMRVATLLVGDAECSLTTLPGPAGGLAANLNRWRAQMGQAPLSDEGIAALPHVKVLGVSSPLVEATGDYTDMQGARHERWALIGVVCPQGARTVFVKLTGSAATLAAERAHFLALVASLH